jgi:hypothetical protein
VDSFQQAANVELLCEHIFSEVGVDICPTCDKDTHRVDWEEQNKLHREWIASGKARYLGWFSI